MTQIKLRRDTAANFTSANPVLGVGEPAYETDTKKLKIGDGTTAYTQLEYFSAGGGGSTNITATLPLKIVDGVISLEVDGQTIQIVDGKLHANLDELGNEVNNLSGRVTAAEADIMKKEDKLTPVAPIAINKYVKSNLHGFSFTADSTGVYATSGQSLGYSDFPSQTPGNRDFEHNTVISSADESWACYIDVPISLGQVVKFPVPDATIYQYPMCILGKTDATGHFTVITHGYALSYNRYNPIDDTLVFNDLNVYTKNRLDYSSTSLSTNVAYNQDPYTGFVQLFEDEAGTFSIQIHKCYGASMGKHFHCTSKYVISDVSAINRFKEINTVRIVPFYTGTKNGTTADSAISVNSIGLYNCSTDLFSLNNNMSQFNTGNLFDISGETAHNYLELNIGSGLAITDGKLTASSTAPANMVTTDTVQNISGQKEFDKTILFLSNNDLLRAQQSTSYRNGAGLSMGANSTSTDGGVFAPQWKIYSTTGDVERTETIITTHNQSRLNSSNFNTANKLVKLDSDGKLPAIDGSQLTNLSGGSAPTNMVTTDTAQTITGLKTFGGTDLSKILLEGNKSLIGFRQNIDSLPTTLIGGFFDSNGKKSITIGSTDHETLSLNAKSVQDGSGNKFLTSGNVAAYITETYVNGTSGYRLYSDKYIEQWGYKSGVNGETITFLKAFKDTNYNIVMATENASVYFQGNYKNKTTTSMKIDYTCGQGGTATSTSWMVTGYIA